MNTFNETPSCDTIVTPETPSLSPSSSSSSSARTSSENFDTREAWLKELMYRLSYLMEETQPDSCATIADWRVSCGWPFGSRKAIGQCFGTTASKNGRSEMFISPKLDDKLELAQTLLHEMVHAAVGVKEKHGGQFAKLARKLGHKGKLTVIFSGPELDPKLQAIVDELPDYPHAALSSGMDNGIKKQTTRMIKAMCEDCGYPIRTTRVWLDKGVPACYCGGKFTLAS